MWNVRVCVACLATDVRMYSMSSNNLLQPYQLLAGVQDWEGLPQTVCYECGALVGKFRVFRERCHRAYVTLRDMVMDHDEITLQSIQQIDRRSIKPPLRSPYSRSAVFSAGFNPEACEHRDTRKRHRKKDRTRRGRGVRRSLEYFVEIDKDEVASVKSEIEFAEDLPEVTPSDSDEDLPLRRPSKRSPDTERVEPEVKQERADCGDACGYVEESVSKKELIEDIRMRQHSTGYKTARYKCTLCYKSFPRRDRFDNHMLLHDPVSGQHTCEVCLVRLCSEDSLADHAKKNHSKKYTCSSCRHVSFNQNTAAMHAKSHQTLSLRNTTHLDKLQTTAVKLTAEEQMQVFQAKGTSEEFVQAKFKCKLCFHISSRKEGLERHKRKHDPLISGKVECDVCRLRFKTRQAMTQHQIRSHMKRYTCNTCSDVCYSLSEAKAHRVWHERGCKPGRRRAVKREARDQVGELRETMSIEGLTQEEQVRQFMETRNSDAPFKCSVCLKGHYDAKAFRNHQLKHEPVSGKFQCDICKYRYNKRYHIQRHIVYFHKNQYRCKICNQLFHNRMAATKHHLWHKGKVYECKHCGLQSNILSTHLTHLRLKHPSEHVCGACGEAFVSKLGLHQHHRITHALKEDSTPTAADAAGPYCAECDIQFTSLQAWTKHILISPKHQHERSTIANGCGSCGETFGTAEQLKCHRRASHPPRFQRPRACGRAERRARPCVQCGEMMANARDYWTHFRRAHPGDAYPLQVPMSHICEHCGKGFRCNALLAIHRHVHTGTRNYQCTLCPKSFFNPLNLRNHLVSHSERRPHVCHVCRKGFKFKSALERHMRTHTGVKPYTCEVCSKAFSDSSGCRVHVRSVHSLRPAPAPAAPHRD